MFYSHKNANTEYSPTQDYSITVLKAWGMEKDEIVWWRQQEERH